MGPLAGHLKKHPQTQALQILFLVPTPGCFSLYSGGSGQVMMPASNRKQQKRNGGPQPSGSLNVSTTEERVK